MNGIGFKLGLLIADTESPRAHLAAIGRTIADVRLCDGESDQVTGMAFLFTDATAVIYFDGARSCCESRYMTCDDELTHYIGATLLDVDVSRNAPGGDGQSETADYEEHEWAFVDFKTARGVLSATMHNRHNGYYGGIILTARTITPDEFAALTARQNGNSHG